jgi:hypothetical protein
MPLPPTVADVRAWAGVTPADISNDQITLILSSEAELQGAACDFYPEDIPELPEPLVQALLRRCARAIAARGLPLGSLPATTSGMGDPYGMPRSMLLPRLDAEVERYEAPFRVIGIA